MALWNHPLGSQCKFRRTRVVMCAFDTPKFSHVDDCFTRYERLGFLVVDDFEFTQPALEEGQSTVGGFNLLIYAGEQATLSAEELRKFVLEYYAGTYVPFPSSPPRFSCT